MSVTNQDTDITWRYVDCQGAAIKALRDYATMEAIIASTPDDLKAIKADVPSLSSPKLDGSRGCFNPPPRERGSDHAPHGTHRQPHPQIPASKGLHGLVQPRMASAHR